MRCRLLTRVKTCLCDSWFVNMEYELYFEQKPDFIVSGMARKLQHVHQFIFSFNVNHVKPCLWDGVMPTIRRSAFDAAHHQDITSLNFEVKPRFLKGLRTKITSFSGNLVRQNRKSHNGLAEIKPFTEVWLYSPVHLSQRQKSRNIGGSASTFWTFNHVFWLRKPSKYARLYEV